MCTIQEEVELCYKPVMEGACDNSYPRWYFDSDLAQCQQCKNFFFKAIKNCVLLKKRLDILFSKLF